MISELKTLSQHTVSHLKEDLKTIRTGRANPSMLESMVIEAYGGQSKLKLMELATITTEGPSTIVIMPFDPSTVGDIEKSILKSPIGFTPRTQGTRILVAIPPLSEEQRQKITKVVNSKIEEKKVAVRNHRDDARKKIKQQFESKFISEDQKYRLEKEIDTLTQEFTSEIHLIKEQKDKEIMEV